MNRIEARAWELLTQSGITAPEVNLDKVIKKMGVIHVTYDMGNDLSGTLLENGKSSAIIAVNSNHAVTRRRFSTAHEIGHLALHSKPGKAGLRVHRRLTMAGSGGDPQEREANAFAAALLMPQPFLDDDFNGEVAERNRTVGNLARRYRVSPAAMTFRLMNLGYPIVE